MAAIAPIVLLDAQATPVAKTFTPTTAAMNMAVWQDRSSGILTGMPTIMVSSRLPVKQSDLFKVQVTIKLPVMEVLSNSTVSGVLPAPQVAYTCTARVDLLLPARSSLANRKDLQKMISNLLVNTQLVSLVENFESAY